MALIETYSVPWVKALTANKTDGMLDFVGVWNSPPDTANRLTPSGFNARGVIDVGMGGEEIFSRMKIMPFCEGPAGAVFWMRVYGWSPMFRSKDQGNHRDVSWIPTLLVEFLCIAGSIPGPEPVDNVTPDPLYNTRYLTPQENLCDAITLTSGVLGLNGWINSNYPGSGIPALAGFEFYGVKKISFDFACDFGLYPELTGVGMNCFWQRL